MAMSVYYENLDGELISENRGGTETFYTSDTLGSVIECRDDTGTKIYGAEYWAYGEVRITNGSNPSPWFFVGTLGYHGVNFVGTYVRRRVLKPQQARWATVDPLWPEESAYAYVDNDPLGQEDPSGARPCPSGFKAACKAQCKVEFSGTMCKKHRWTCRIIEIYLCGRPVFFSYNCTCQCKSCKAPPKPKIQPHPKGQLHYFRALGCCCYGGHTHIITYHVGPPPSCKVDATKKDGTCFGDCRPGPCPP